MKELKKLGAVLALMAIIVGAGCGIGINFYHHEPFAGVCCIVLTLAVVPTVRGLVKFLLDK